MLLTPNQRKLSFHNNEKSIKIVEDTEPIPVSIVGEANSVNVVSEASETVVVDQPVNVTGECVPELANVMNEVSAKVLVMKVLMLEISLCLVLLFFKFVQMSNLML